MAKFVVTEKAQRPADPNSGRCFYCHQSVGTHHSSDCVLIKKKIKVRMTIEYDRDVPASWGKDMIEFHMNDSSWCGDNALDEIDKFKGDSCICHIADFEYIQDMSGPELDE